MRGGIKSKKGHKEKQKTDANKDEKSCAKHLMIIGRGEREEREEMEGM